MNSLVKKLKQIVIFLAIATFSMSCSQVPSLSESGENPWHPVDLPTGVTLLDIDFIGNSSHGWAVGGDSTLLETNDGGDTWQPKKLEIEDQKLNFTSVSFAGEQGWVTGDPSVLLHTTDGGESWFRIPLSENLPGSPYQIVALGSDSAEMTTDLGAIYKTDNGGRNWRALVEDTVGVVRNISRSSDGRYVAVSARGNFYSTWKPGQSAWEAHERNTSRRIQNMGFGEDGRMWMLARGGQVQFTKPGDFETWEEPQYPEPSTSWGLLDVGYRTPKEMWVAGGSANLLASFDDGKTWKKVRKVEDIPANFYRAIFLSPDRGFVLGNEGVMLKYEPPSEPV